MSDGITFNHFARIEEAYSWKGDVMRITSQIVHEADEARLNNIAEHFEVDLSEIREYISLKALQKLQPQTNFDAIRTMSIEELASWLSKHLAVMPEYEEHPKRKIRWIEWLKRKAGDPARGATIPADHADAAQTLQY